MREEIVLEGSSSGRYTFAPAVRFGNLVFVSGMTASDEHGKVVAPGDIVEQTRFIYRKLERVLRAASATMDDVVMTREYIVSTERYKETAEVRREFFGDRFPAATGVIVAGLLRREALIEIEAIAATDEE